MTRNANTAGLARHNAPSHRRAGAHLSSERRMAGVMRADRSGRIELSHTPPLREEPGGNLGIALGGGLKLEGGAIVASLGKGLNVSSGRIGIARIGAVATNAQDSNAASVGYVQAEAQATMDKVDQVIVVLRKAGMLEETTAEPT